MDNTISSYVNLLEELKSSTKDDVAALALLQEIGKDRRTSRINGNSSNSAATQKQKAYLQKLGVEFEPDISKAEASQLIDEALLKN